jgi:hypothetical protein
MFFSKRNDAPLIKIPARTAADVCKECELEPATKPLLESAQTPAEFLQALEKKPFAGEALKFLAHALPEREAVWWLCQSARLVEGSLNTAELQALAAAEKWVRDPSANNKLAAQKAAGNTDKTGPGGWAAQAAAWSQHSNGPTPPAGKSSAPPDPTAGLTAPAVSGGILLAAGLVDKPRMPEAKLPDLSAPAISAPQVSMPGVAMPAAPGLNVPSLPAPAIPGVAFPQPAVPAPPSMPALPGAPALTPPQMPAANLPAPAMPGLPSPPGITAPQVPGVPQIQAPQLNVSAPAMPGMPAMPAIAAPEIPPLDQKKLAKMLKPFLELGREVAAGKNAWT